MACFISNLVCRLLAGDKTITRVRLSLKDEDRKFESIVKLMNGGTIELTPDNIRFMEECARQLENHELLGMIVGFKLDREGVGRTNLVERFRLREEFHSSCQQEWDYAASHFFELDDDVYAKIGVHNLEAILTNSLLQLDTEDQLFEIISSLIKEHGDKYAVLLRYVQFAFLSPSNLSSYLDMVFPDLVDESMWQTMRKYLHTLCISSVKYSIEQKGRHHYEVFTPESGAFVGIISRLRDNCGGNPHEKGTISITASSNDYNSCNQVVNYGWKSYWRSSNSSNSWIQFDFKSSAVSLSGYSIRTGTSCSNYHPVQWVIELSNDRSTWETVDERDTKDLSTDDTVQTFECNKPSHMFARYIRLKQTGANLSGSHYLCFSEIEFFGKVSTSTT